MTVPGELLPLTIRMTEIPCLGLTYRSHVEETYGRRTEDIPPELFPKRVVAPLMGGGDLKLPSRSDLLATVRTLDPTLAARLDRSLPHLPPMLDYEIELGLILLEPLTSIDLQDPDYCPRLGYFLANDATARSLQVLGEGDPQRLAFWSAAKSLPGFLAVGERMWVPRRPTPDGRVEFLLTTTVNGEVRQRASTLELLHSPRQMLAVLLEGSHVDRLEAGTCLLTGTPGGIALSVAAWQRRLAGLLPGRLTRLKLAIRAGARNRRFLKAGDHLVLSGGELGTLSCTVSEAREPARV